MKSRAARVHGEDRMMGRYTGWENVKPKSKYGAVRTQVDGVYFDSKREAARYTELNFMRQAKKITNLECHPSFEITINDIKVCVVELDFKYFDMTRGEYVYEDVKSSGTKNNQLSTLKRKLVQASYGIKVELIGV